MVRMIVGLLLVVCAGTADAAPRDFTTETRAIYSVAACGEAPPASYDARVVAAHCKELARAVAQWRKNWFDKASPWLAKEVGKYPSTVVYPFGGGDVVTMLSVYPDATEYTSLSLEGIGDPRPLAKLDRAKLTTGLGKLRTMLSANLNWAWNTTIQLSIDSSESGAGIPGILTIALVALDAHGYEPIEARYFELAADGSPAYVTQEMIDKWDAEQGKAQPKRKQTHALQQGLFNNIEITFRKKGDPKAPKKVFRHIAADLSDAGLASNGGALAYLNKRGEFAAITKAASYLLWKTEFDKIRSVLLAKMKIMISDDTGIPPRYAKAAGFTQQVYGQYSGAFFKWARGGDPEKEMIALWKGSTSKLPFRFGYYDSNRTPHLMITRK
jgi:hypothetical protein